MNSLKSFNKVNIQSDFLQSIYSQIEGGENLQVHSLFQQPYNNFENALQILQQENNYLKQEQIFTEDKFKSMNQYLKKFDFSDIEEKMIININIELLSTKRFNQQSNYNHQKIQIIKNVFNELAQKVHKFYFDIDKRFFKDKLSYSVLVSFSKTPLIKMFIQVKQKNDTVIDNFISLMLIKWIYPMDFIKLFYMNDFESVPDYVNIILNDINVSENFQTNFNQFQKNMQQEEILFIDTIKNEKNQVQQDEEFLEEEKQFQKNSQYLKHFNYTENIIDSANLNLDQNLEDLIQQKGRPLEDKIVSQPYTQNKIKIIKHSDTIKIDKKNHIEVLKQISEKIYLDNKENGLVIDLQQQNLLQQDFESIKKYTIKEETDINIDISLLLNCSTHFEMLRKLSQQKLYFKLETKYDHNTDIIQFILYQQIDQNNKKLFSEISIQKKSENQYTKFIKTYFILNSFKQFIQQLHSKIITNLSNLIQFFSKCQIN